MKCYFISFVVVINLFSIYFLYKLEYRNDMECGKSNLKSLYFQYHSKCVICKNIFKRMLNRKPAIVWPPPKYPPDNLIKEFTQNGEMPIEGIYYVAQRYSGGSALTSVWSKSLIDGMVEKYKKREVFGTYVEEDINIVCSSLKKYNINNKDVAVIGSEHPWIEAIISTKNPKSITTIEYGKIKSNVSLLTVYTPKEFAEKTLKESIKFDVVISYSSVEHSGLGRYGDELEPNGDINAVEEIYCMLKKEGLFFLSVPFSNKSSILWNAHRYYGPERLKYLMANFEQLEYYGEKFSRKQGIIVFRKT